MCKGINGMGKIQLKNQPSEEKTKSVLCFEILSHFIASLSIGMVILAFVNSLSLTPPQPRGLGLDLLFSRKPF